MSLLPWGLNREMNPFADIFEPIDPYSPYAIINRPLRRMERRMESEMGKMRNEIKEDDKTFQVVIFVFISDFPLFNVTLCVLDRR